MLPNRALICPSISPFELFATMSAPPAPTCNCWAATIRIINLSREPYHPSSSPSGQPLARNMSLSDVQLLGRNLVQHWEALNGCASSDLHLRPPAVCFMADAISRILGLYDMVVDGSGSYSSPGNSWGPVSRSTPAAANTSTNIKTSRRLNFVPLHELYPGL